MVKPKRGVGPAHSNGGPRGGSEVCGVGLAHCNEGPEVYGVGPAHCNGGLEVYGVGPAQVPRRTRGLWCGTRAL